MTILLRFIKRLEIALKIQPIIDAFNEGYLYLIEEYGWKSNADVITPFVNFHRIAVPTPKTEENPSGIDIYYIFDTSQPHDAEED